ncbi:hypothetical protein JAAARDRAFT_126989 [Jaapia argillacea MUCL 33604]|uniref:PEBP-like protein n=1 Tax=Jaapia argillacea MUCL 33604 TaxID=933084 RepID=A0A067QA08_9AGAM|nr:hypothetical protein JAAARDRAFT_126989 [Jaapia argillacea MUCL 33604]
MIALPLVALAFFSFAFAQSNEQLQIEAIEAHFKQSGIVPSLLPTFNPTGTLNVTFNGVGAISPGQPLTQANVQPTPTVVYTPANASVSLNGNYTIIMADAGPVGTDETAGQTRHWLVNDVTLSGSNPLNVTTTNGTAITDYAGPAPASGSGPHRYVIMLWNQPATFKSPAGTTTGVGLFNLTDYVSASGLGPLAAANYFTVEVGTASFTPSPTSAVITSTLAPVSSGGSSSGSTKTTSTGASSSTAKSSASKFEAGFALVLAPILGMIVL